ncbi:hypothetical protein JMUB3933_0143 [Leptotrichia wadei]|uniref:Uncharacterized protein n=1 Tax=Leptotrichia wadei TaxID=157687 RepID=A0A510K4X1_9FUSO|nr:hypothetical protein [Leptotrichia wadei]BBM46668.1 hypothetical protein JMUB3933_0143 [Leptotrichia wadei]
MYVYCIEKLKMMTVAKWKKRLPFIFLFLGILISCVSYIISNTEIKIFTNDINVEAENEILKGTRIYQDIYIPKNLKKYGIIFATYARKNTGKIRVKIVQGSIEKEELIDVSKLKDNDVRYLNLNYKAFKKGIARLIIEGVDGTSGNAVTVYKSEDISLGKMVVNNQNTGKGILQKMEYREANSMTKVQIVLTVFVFFLLLHIDRLIKKDKDKKLYFAAIVLMYCLVTIKAPTITVFTEPFAELITNYFFNVTTMSTLKGLFSSDAGYFVLYPRLIALIVVKGLRMSPRMSVILMQNFAMLLMLSINSAFILNNYKKYGNIFFRFTVSLILGSFSIFPFFETHVFVDLPYFNLVAIILISLLDFESLSKKKFILLMISVPILCFSKSYFLLFLPISVLISIIFWKKIYRRQKIYLFLLGLSALFQVMYMYFNKDGWKVYSNSDVNLNFIDIVNNIFYPIFQNVRYLFYPNITSSNILNMNLIFSIITILGIISGIYYLYRYRNKESIISVALIMITFGVTLLNIVSKISNDKISWESTPGIIENRHSFFILIPIIFFGILFIYNYLKEEKNERKKSRIYTLIGLLLFIRFLVFDNTMLPNVRESYSDWKIYSKFYNENEYLIPVEPSLWSTSKNVDVHYTGYREIHPIIRDDTKIKKIFINPYIIKQIHEINFESPIYLTHLYLTRLRADNFNKLKVRGYDSNGNVVVELNQLNDKARKNIGFRNYKRVKISKVEIFTEDSQEAYVFPTILYGTALK